MSSGLLGSAVAKADSAAGAPRRLRGLPPAKSEAVYACAMVLRQAVRRHEQEGGGLAEAQTLFTAPEVRGHRVGGTGAPGAKGEDVHLMGRR